MCGRYTSTAAFDELALRFGITVESGTNEELAARFNVAPTQNVPIITASEKGGKLVMAKWGFRPAWVTDGKLAPINARTETVAMSRLFGAAVRDGRCLVPATGFYEWKLVRGQKRKQPFHVRLKGGGLRNLSTRTRHFVSKFRLQPAFSQRPWAGLRLGLMDAEQQR